MRPADPNKGIWPTPGWLFGPLNVRFNFGLDAAASRENTKCKRYYTEKDNGLVQPWDAPCTWCNPPYGTDPSTDAWVQHGRRNAVDFRNTQVMLVPVKAETAWYQDLVWGENRVIRSAKPVGRFGGRWYLLQEKRMLVEVLELRGRVSFGVDRKGNGFFASALVAFGAQRHSRRHTLLF